MGMATEISLMSYLSVCLTQDWGIGNTKESLLSSIIFAGQIFGALLWGFVGDMYGRKMSLTGALALVVLSGFTTIFSVNFSMLACMRFLVGLGTGGLYLPINYLAEILPAETRGFGVSIVGFFWAIGNVYVAGFAWLLLPSHTADGWRSLSLICMIPSALALIMSLCFPESPRWLLSQQREVDSRRVVNIIAARSNKTLPPFMLEPPPGQEKGGTLLDLLSRKYLSLNIRVWTIWFCVGFSYYGLVLFISRVFVTNDDDDGNDLDDNDDTHNLCSFRFLPMFISSLAEIPAAIMPLVLLERFGRNTLQTSFCVLGCVSCLFLGAVPGITGKTISAFCGRAVLRSAFNVAIIAVTELYPTHMRSFSGAVSVFISRVGAFISPYLVQNDNITIMAACIVLTCTSALMGLSALVTPDTRQMRLDDKVDMELDMDMAMAVERLSLAVHSLEIEIVGREVNEISTIVGNGRDAREVVDEVVKNPVREGS